MARVMLDPTLERSVVTRCIKLIDEYEQVKHSTHPEFYRVKDLFEARNVPKQIFHTIYRRFRESNRDPRALLPQKPGPKRGLMMHFSDEITKKVMDFRKQGYNRYEIRHILLKTAAQGERIPSESTIYRIARLHGIGKLQPIHKEEKRTIIKTFAGELGHLDAHYLPKDIIKGVSKQTYLVGLIDSYTRICWIEVVSNIKALHLSYRIMESMLILKHRYEIQFKSILTDNGKEFGNRANIENHPVEQMFKHFNIKHRYTRPYRPQTNGKIERLWRSINNELLINTQYDSMQDLKDAIIGYCYYYNEHRPHQAICGKIPKQMLTNKL